MIENATNLANATVRASEGFLGFLSDYWQELSALAALITIIAVVIGLVFEWIRCRKYKRAAKEQIIKHLEQFIWLEETEKDRVKLDNYYQIKIEKIGNDLKGTLRNIDKKFILFPRDFLKNTHNIANEIITLSKGRNIDTKGYDTLMKPVVRDRIKMREEAGRKLMEKAKEVIEVLKKWR